ncbi:MAG TPA: hypothetical protein VFY27_05575 [Woeseiaceae bacterium]|nr:hypothetical protein [Woeseiaceae bacterium]
MKLRIQDNSIRLRLTRSEVDELSADGSVTASVSFPDGATLEYSLETSSLTGQPRAQFSSDRLVVQIPEAVARRWAVTEEVSITGGQPLEDGALSILVEKDFACLTPREGEDDSDMFPHPLKGQENC